MVIACRANRKERLCLMRFNYEVAVDFNRPGAEQLNDINEATGATPLSVATLAATRSVRNDDINAHSEDVDRADSNVRQSYRGGVRWLKVMRRY